MMRNNPDSVISQLETAYGIDITPDLASHPEWTPSVSSGEVNQDGAAYTYIEVSYSIDGVVQATRSIARILPGNRTEIAYWTEEAPTKPLDVHQGKGKLILGDPIKDSTQEILIDASSGKKILLPSGHFYTIRAEENAAEPLVVSGFYEPSPDWAKLQIALEPGQTQVQAKEGVRKIPSDFKL